MPIAAQPLQSQVRRLHEKLALGPKPRGPVKNTGIAVNAGGWAHIGRSMKCLSVYTGLGSRVEKM